MRRTPGRLQQRSSRLLWLAVIVSLLGSSPWVASAGHEPRQISALHPERVVFAETLVGGFMNPQFSAHCMRALVTAAVACSQVGPAGLAGCGVALHLTQGACP